MRSETVSCLVSYGGSVSELTEKKAEESNALSLYETTVTTFSILVAASALQHIEHAELERSCEGLLNVGYLDQRSVLTYREIDIPQAGTYRFIVRYASPGGSGRFVVRDSLTGNAYTVVQDLKLTGGWQSWSIVQNEVNLRAGPVSLQIKVLEGGFNLLWWSLEWMGTTPC